MIPRSSMPRHKTSAFRWGPSLRTLSTLILMQKRRSASPRSSCPTPMPSSATRPSLGHTSSPVPSHFGQCHGGEASRHPLDHHQAMPLVETLCPYIPPVLSYIRSVQILRIIVPVLVGPLAGHANSLSAPLQRPIRWTRRTRRPHS